MPRPSSISRLPSEVRKAIAQLREKGRTIDEILTHLARLDVEVSRSALGRHLKAQEAMTLRLRYGREIAEAMGREFGEDDGRLARVNIEALHTVVVEILARIQEGQALEAKEARALAETVALLTRASRNDQDFAERIEKRAADAARRAAAGAAEQAARSAGLNAPLIETIKRAVLGLST